jgi:transcriptional regulator with XRE-family HTH domain
MTTPDPLVVGLAALRRERGLSQQEIAELIGVDRVTISRVENGHVSPRLSLLIGYARIVGARVVVMPTDGVVVASRALAS